MPLFQKATYAASVATPLDPYPQAEAEIAFAGRSNAGKSSAINTLVGQRRLAFVSKKPGRTQMINFFSLGEGRFLVDLPGYGYASAPERIRSQWDRLLGTYLKHRDALKGIALVMDIRHPFTELDRRLMDYFHQSAKPVHILLTKADKLSQARADEALREAAMTLAQLSPRHSVQLFSSLKRRGIEEAEAVFSRWLGLEPLRKKVPSPSAGQEWENPRPGSNPRVNSGTRGRNKRPRAKGG
jgi:GTP-binding protein